MKNNLKKENKICFILYTISSCLFLFTGIMILVEKGRNVNLGITDIGLSITFGSLAIMYYKKYKNSK
ncbi:MAG: hypothetical protein J6O56_03485 [Bacilli bacterium]|nr:hypothetical protein [Bacilli bacterium]